MHLKDGATLEGVLVGRVRGHYVLEQASVVEAEGRTVPMSGSARVPAVNVMFVQVLP